MGKITPGANYRALMAAVAASPSERPTRLEVLPS
jgi:hypothetical protein